MVQVKLKGKLLKILFLFYMGEGQSFSSILMFNWLDTAYPMYRGQYSFLCWLIPGFPGGSVVKDSLANVEDTRDTSSFPGVGKILGVGNGNHYSILAWKIPWTEEPGRLYSMGSQRVWHEWVTSHSPKWNHMAYIYFCLDSINQHCGCEIYSCCCT